MPGSADPNAAGTMTLVIIAAIPVMLAIVGSVFALERVATFFRNRRRRSIS